LNEENLICSHNFSERTKKGFPFFPNKSAKFLKILQNLNIFLPEQIDGVASVDVVRGQKREIAMKTRKVIAS
jgi:hypothetical protein